MTTGIDSKFSCAIEWRVQYKNLEAQFSWYIQHTLVEKESRGYLSFQILSKYFNPYTIQIFISDANASSFMGGFHHLCRKIVFIRMTQFALLTSIQRIVQNEVNDLPKLITSLNVIFPSLVLMTFSIVFFFENTLFYRVVPTIGTDNLHFLHDSVKTKWV